MYQRLQITFSNSMYNCKLKINWNNIYSILFVNYVVLLLFSWSNIKFKNYWIIDHHFVHLRFHMTTTLTMQITIFDNGRPPLQPPSIDHHSIHLRSLVWPSSTITLTTTNHHSYMSLVEAVKEGSWIKGLSFELGGTSWSLHTVHSMCYTFEWELGVSWKD